MTYKSGAVVTEGGLHVGGLLEVVDEPQPQLGADDTCPHKVCRDLLSANEALPGSTHNTDSQNGGQYKLANKKGCLCRFKIVV